MDRKLLLGAVALFILELFVSTIDSGWLKWPGTHSFFSKARGTKVVIGTVIDTEPLVQRKSQNSILWESIQKSDSLAAYDSILTLGNSTASFRLKNDIQINLSGNTLIVIEPSVVANKNALKTKIQKGHVRSHSQQKDFSVQSQEWTIEAQSASEISVLETNSENLEVEVHKGKALLKSSNGDVQKKIDTGVRVKNSDSKKLDVFQIQNSNFAWKYSKLSVTQYDFLFPLEWDIEWTGPAENLEIIRPGQSIEVIAIDSGKQSHKVSLLAGDTFFRLTAPGVSSETLRVQARDAEKIPYLSPLPRDRVEANQLTTFVWKYTPPSQSPEIQFSKTLDFSEIAERYGSSQARLELKLRNTGPLFWRVEDRDEEGARIPAYYTYTLYHVPDLLSPPQLRPFMPRAPAKADDTSSSLDRRHLLQELFDWILPQAQANPPATQDLKKAVIFSWYEVPGADHYVIEIAEDATFLKPIVTQKIKTVEFSWSGFAFKTYYYRLAAGQDNGRMGQFSAPEKADLSALQSETFSKELQPGVRLAIEKPSKNSETSSTKTASNEKKSETSQDVGALEKKGNKNPIVSAQQKFQFHLFWSGGYILNFHSREQNVKANQAGWTAERLGIELTTPLKAGYFGASAESNEVPWISSEKDFPFQQELTQRTLFAQAFFGTHNDRNPWGIFYQTIGLAQRVDNESIELESVEFYGLTTQTQYDFLDSWGTKHRLGLGYGGKMGLFRTDNFVYRTLDIWATQTGRTGVEFNLLYGQGQSSVNFIYSQIMYRLEFCF